MKTKDRILEISVELFNAEGVGAVTTNHIAKALNMSPGNLYFHYRNKEEILFRIFKNLCTETYQIWRLRGAGTDLHPLRLMALNFELYWKYRFFHREMYSLRRRDPNLAKAWRRHVEQIKKRMVLTYAKWVRRGWMKAIETDEEKDFVVTVILSTSSTFLQFLEGADRLPKRQSVERGQRCLARLLVHWSVGSMREDFENFLKA